MGDLLQESQRALKRTNALTLADLIALSGAESLAAVGGPEISVQLGRTDNPELLNSIKAVSKGGLKEAQARGIAPAFDVEGGTLGHREGLPAVGLHGARGGGAARRAGYLAGRRRRQRQGREEGGQGSGESPR